MSKNNKYNFDGSNYDNWKPSDIPAGFCCPDSGTSVACYTGGWRSNRPIWDAEKCTNCLMCWAYCPDSCIQVKDAAMTGIDLFHCKGCGVCVAECKFGALELTTEAEAQAAEAKGE